MLEVLKSSRQPIWMLMLLLISKLIVALTLDPESLELITRDDTKRALPQLGCTELSAATFEGNVVRGIERVEKAFPGASLCAVLVYPEDHLYPSGQPIVRDKIELRFHVNATHDAVTRTTSLPWGQWSTPRAGPVQDAFSGWLDFEWSELTMKLSEAREFMRMVGYPDSDLRRVAIGKSSGDPQSPPFPPVPGDELFFVFSSGEPDSPRIWLEERTWQIFVD